MKQKLLHFFRFYWKVLKGSIQRFLKEDIFTHAAGLAYYTIFALPPMLMVILFTTTIFYDRTTMRRTIFGEISSLVGPESARSLATTLDRIGLFEGSWWASAISIAVLVFTSTTVFVTIQNALNRIFGVKPKPKTKGWLKMIRDRLISFALLLSIAFILIVSLVLTALISALGDYLSRFVPEVSIVIATVASELFPFLIITALFGLIFRYLPDVEIHWKDTIVGALVTSFLFLIGKFLISFYIANSQAANLYEAAGSVMVILLWVFYASIIFLFGGAFTRVYIEEKRGEIAPNSFSVKVRQKIIEEPAAKGPGAEGV
ncbi:MAG: YihY/virulence factor BrkB family protein [Phaeodactylibacter sp.]|nr:YihY/virulence factor BrkB family protein [Phaeodactylibacter sp.]MCB9292632.1 YihY/virulence factor BrkB family protein [Lewinellaceae bacterium]